MTPEYKKYWNGLNNSSINSQAGLCSEKIFDRIGDADVDADKSNKNVGYNKLGRVLYPERMGAAISGARRESPHPIYM